jgi:hypothetical protein
LYEFRTRFGNHHLQIGLLLGVRNCGRSACRLVEYHHLGDEDLDVSDVRKRRSTPRRKPYGPRGDDTPPRRGFAERFDISLNWLICGEGYGLSPRLARNHGGKCNPPGNGTDQSQSTAISLKMARGRQSLAARLPVRG